MTARILTARILAAFIAAAIVVTALWLFGLEFERGIGGGLMFAASWATGLGTFLFVGGVKP